MKNIHLRMTFFSLIIAAFLLVGCQTGRRLPGHVVAGGSDQTLSQPDDLEIWEDAPDEFQRKHYEAQAQAAKDYVVKQVKLFREIEEKRGKVTDRGPNGEKVVVNITDSRGKVIGKLIYMGDDWIWQYVEWKNRKMDGVTAFMLKDGTPFRIMTYKSNELDGPMYEFEKKGDHAGTLIHYIEFKNNMYQGLRLGWTPEGISLKGCKRIDDPIAVHFFPM
ncbi:hypothetical protein K8I31_04540 [bacterium]|nr:hypothetical protein [bacterium]